MFAAEEEKAQLSRQLRGAGAGGAQAERTSPGHRDLDWGVGWGAAVTRTLLIRNGLSVDLGSDDMGLGRLCGAEI